MSHLPVVSGRECVKILCKVGFEVARQRGSHIILRKEFDCKEELLTVIFPTFAKPSRKSWSVTPSSNMISSN